MANSKPGLGKILWRISTACPQVSLKLIHSTSRCIWVYSIFHQLIFFGMLGHDKKDFAYKKQFFEKFHFNCPVVPKVSPIFLQISLWKAIIFQNIAQQRHKASVNGRDIDLAQFETRKARDWGLRSESCTGNVVIFSCREFWDCRWLIFENVLYKQLCFCPSFCITDRDGNSPKDYFPQKLHKSYINFRFFSTSIPRVIPTNPRIPGNLASGC